MSGSGQTPSDRQPNKADGLNSTPSPSESGPPPETTAASGGGFAWPPGKVLVIGYGNDLRRDDGAGLRLAEGLTAQWLALGAMVDCSLVHQLLPELAAAIAEPTVTTVVFIDARRSVAAEGLQVMIQPVRTSEAETSLGHHLSPAALMLYARHLYGHEPSAWLVTVPGVDFAHGEGLSAPVQKLVEQTVANAADLLDQIGDFSAR